MTFASITDIHLSLNPEFHTIMFPGQEFLCGSDNEHIENIRSAIGENPDKKMVTLADGGRWRVQRMREDRFALRRMRDTCPDIETLGLPVGIKSLLLKSEHKSTGGLIMILGPAGAGKTTTFSATIKARLALHGGYCLSIEDPPEDLLEGKHGASGYCEQIDADDIGGYESAIHTALRCFPAKDSSMLAYGEVRDKTTAAELLRIGVDGHLVLVTAHSKTIPTGIQRISALAKAAGESDANDLIATSLRLAIHQKFDARGKLIVEALIPEPATLTNIRKGDFSGLKSCVDRTMSILKSGGM